MFKMSLGDEDPIIRILGMDAFVVEKSVINWEDQK